MQRSTSTPARADRRPARLPPVRRTSLPEGKDLLEHLRRPAHVASTTHAALSCSSRGSLLATAHKPYRRCLTDLSESEMATCSEAKPSTGPAVRRRVSCSSTSTRLEHRRTSSSATSSSRTSCDSPSTDSSLLSLQPLLPAQDEAERGPLQRWQKGKVIAHGSRGRVYKVRETESGFIYAMKEAPVRDGEHVHLQGLRESLDMLKALPRHPNICSVMGYEETATNLCIFLEYIPGGSMKHFLQEFGPLSMPPLKDAARGCLQGLRFLHSRAPAVVHGDIRSANLLVEHTADSKVALKLTDCFRTASISEARVFNTLGSFPWAAPEAIVDGTVGKESDVWSFGCTVLEMATAEQPWGDRAFDTIINVLRHIAKPGAVPPIPNCLPQECQDFVWKCLQRELSERWSVEELCLHSFAVDPSRRILNTGDRSTDA